MYQPTNRPVCPSSTSPFAWLAVLLIVAAAAPAGAAPEPVFINEIHYDNSGGDVGEAIEIAGPAGTDLTGWDLVLYNGSTGATYGTENLAGTLPDEGSGYGTLSFPISGIQNGSPDGVALIDSLGAVVQFLSYEGSFVAAGGPAAGQSSADVGVFEPNTTPVGQSLQLAGTGTVAGDFTWSSPSADSFGSVNSGQTFVAAAIELVIHEIMQNPDAVFDSDGEWFELFNPNASVVDVEGWSFEDLGSNAHTITNGGPLLIAAGGYLVLGNNDDSLTNGGVAVDYEYSSFTLANGDDEVILLDALGFESDRVEYDGGPAFPDPTGASMALADPALDNNDGANWCVASTSYGAGDLGTPGAANDCGVPPVPALVIHEIIPDPFAVFDSNGEWIEIFNPTASPVDVDGFTLADGGSDSHTINNGGPLVIAAGGYLVLGINDDSLTNGGVTVDYEYSGFFLGNSDDEVILLDTLLREVDRVEYDGGPAFPDPTGASMALIDPSFDNNDGASWCTSSTPFGDGDSGTPGAANDCVIEVPELVINEIIQNPAAVGDGNGEWLELFNPTVDPVDVDGFTLRDDGSNIHVIANGGPLVIAGGGFLVLGRDDNPATNGGVALDYEYSNYFLANGDDEVILLDTFLNEVDRVEYDGGPSFPDPTGASMALASPAVDNNVGANWCTSSTPFGDGDLGTPGAVNDCPPPELVINEIMQNPSAVGDSAGEWFEVYNPSGAAVDVNGWTIRDDGSNSHVIANGGALLVPPGGYLVLGNNNNSGTNGGVTVDYEYSSFFLGNSDDEVVLIDALGNEIDRVNYDGGPSFPDPTGASMALLIPGFDNNDGANWCTSSTPFGAGDAGTPGAVNDCSGTPEIYDLQGSGAFSPFEDLAVITRDNVVTAVRNNGFFIQTPDARDDFDAATSNGIFVFSGGFPGVAVGDLVTVVGTVVEFFAFTELDDAGLSFFVTGTATAPDPVLLDDMNPDPGPFDPPDMERFEGMLVELVNGIATGPTDGFGDVAVTVGPARTFREEGIEFPSPFAGPPEWDANQEVFEVDPDALGLPDADVVATRAVSAIGPLAFSFGDYQIWPQALILGPEPAIEDPVRARVPGELTVGSFNLFRLNGGFAKLAAYVVEVLDSPDILAIQEVDDVDELEDLADQIAVHDPGVVYAASLIEGNDPGGIDIGFLTRPNVQIDSLTQVDPDVTFVNPVTLQDNILHDRPPLLLEGSCQLEFGSFPIAVMAIHNRSLLSIEDPVQGLRVRKKRFLQAVSIAEKVEAMQAADPDRRLVVTGDFNAFEFTDGYVDTVGVITGDFDPLDNLVCTEEDCNGLPDNDLFDEAFAVPASDRYSFVFGGNAQVLDHALTSAGLAAEISGVEYGRGNADAYADLLFDTAPANLPLRSSDHDGLVVFILKDEDADGVPNDDDVCAGTTIPEDVPTKGLKPNRYALIDGDGTFDTVTPPGGGAGDVFTLGDTAGCSCEQIIAAQGLGNGHVKHGCSVGAMRNWVDLVNP